ncbi:MAG: methylated-DNA--[protein]-cysteine S-methyltransferase [Acidimicrobiales bacterium]
MFSTTYRSPLGPLELIASDDGLVAILWPDDDPGRVKLSKEAVEQPTHEVLARVASQLDEYFAGKRTEFDIRLDLRGTDFQIEVWRSLATIPYGQTASYGEQAKRVGRPKAVRAIGAANGRNPVSVVLPCHRVVGADGSLTGFAGGLAAKRFLLELEGAIPATIPGTS